eukprot:4175531-Pleurochrysis_carterae.AAC.3
MNIYAVPYWAAAMRPSYVNRVLRKHSLFLSQRHSSPCTSPRSVDCATLRRSLLADEEAHVLHAARDGHVHGAPPPRECVRAERRPAPAGTSRVRRIACGPLAADES